MNCLNCGNKLNENEKFCNKCGTPVPTPKKKNTGLIIGCIIAGVVLILFVAIILIAGLFIIFSIDKKEKTTIPTIPTSTTNTTTKSLDDDNKKKVKMIDFSNIEVKYEDSLPETKNIEFVNAYMSSDEVKTNNYAYVGYINKNDTNRNVWIYINYYKDGVRIGSDEDIVSFVKPNVLTVSEVTLTAQDDYDTVDISIKTTEAASYMRDVEVNSSNYKNINETDNKAKYYGEFTNNTKKEIYGYASCIRYKDNKIVYFHPGYLGTVKAGQKGKCECFASSVPESVDYNKTECNLYNVYYTEGE